MWVETWTNCHGQSVLHSVARWGPAECGRNRVSYLHRVEADRAEAVDAPGERTDRAAPLLIPDVHLLATCCKHSLLLVMIQSCEDCLQGARIFFTIIKMWYFTDPLEDRGHGNLKSRILPLDDVTTTTLQQMPTDRTLPRIVLSGSSSSP